MSLRSQLLLVSLLLLSLPWAGCQYLRETEATLRQGQQFAVDAVAEAIAAALSENKDLLYPAIARREDQAALQWPVAAAAAPLFSDGFENDWDDRNQFLVKGFSSSPVQLHAATWDERLFLLLNVDDDSQQYKTPYSPGDRILLRCIDTLNASSRYVVDAEAPGLVLPTQLSGPSSRLRQGIRGAWREGSDGYAVELQIPLGPACQRLSLQVIDASDAGESVIFDNTRAHQGAPPWLVYQIPALDNWLKLFEQSGRRIVVNDTNGARIGANIGTPRSNEADKDGVFWMLRWIYRAALQTDDDTAEDTYYEENPGQHLPGSTEPARTIAAQANIEHKESLGHVTVLETTERYLALTDRSTGRVFGVSAAVLISAFLGLFIYASVLSWRIRRLGQAAQKIAADELPASDFPRSGAGDELGDLSRSYADLLAQIDDYNRYLRGLASTLSHELRTPIAVVDSSLENLSRLTNETTNQDYVGRARDGLNRLTRIVSAMSEASRIEESLTSVDKEPIAINELINALVNAYTSSFPTHQFEYRHDGTEATLSGNGELLAQAIDKLVENAVSFTDEQQTILVDLSLQTSGLSILISNPGPLLPQALKDSLFEPMVSIRGSKPSESSHLGLGLYIARAICESHGGRLEARNRADESGVEFCLYFPRPAG